MMLLYSRTAPCPRPLIHQNKNKGKRRPICFGAKIQSRTKSFDPRTRKLVQANRRCYYYYNVLEVKCCIVMIRYVVLLRAPARHSGRSRRIQLFWGHHAKHPKDLGHAIRHGHQQRKVFKNKTRLSEGRSSDGVP